MTKRARFIVKGRVQGVCYRMYTRDQAQRHGVEGWVRNLPDGTVEVVCEGKNEAVASLLEWCRQGPPGARVTGIDVSYAEPTGEFDGFMVEYTMRW